jgi:hypothetical protein
VDITCLLGWFFATTFDYSPCRVVFAGTVDGQYDHHHYQPGEGYGNIGNEPATNDKFSSLTGDRRKAASTGIVRKAWFKNK